MKEEMEITVKVLDDFENLDKTLRNKGFNIVDDYQLDDIYLVLNDIDLKNEKVLTVLDNCVLVRNINNSKMMLTKKIKKYAPNGDILKQGKYNCSISNIFEAVNFLKAIGYRELFNINDHITVYSNNDITLAVERVNNKHIFIEIEDSLNDGEKKYNNTNEMIKDLECLGINYDKSSYFVKKAEITFNEIYGDNQKITL